MKRINSSYEFLVKEKDKTSTYIANGRTWEEAFEKVKAYIMSHKSKDKIENIEVLQVLKYNHRFGAWQSLSYIVYISDRFKLKIGRPITDKKLNERLSIRVFSQELEMIKCIKQKNHMTARDILFLGIKTLEKGNEKL